MRWLPASEAGPILGIDADALGARGRRGTHERKRGPNGWLYALPDDALGAGSRAVDEGAERVTAALDADAGVTGWCERDGYVYDGERDAYIVTIPGLSRPFVRPGAWVRALWRSYTSDGQTIAGIAREFEIDRKTFEGLKRALGLTKTRAYWTDEELATTPEDDLYRDALRIKERAILSKVERAEWRRVKEDATKWANVRESVRAMFDAREHRDPAVVIPRVDLSNDQRGGGAVVVGLTDMHVGKRAAGEDHTLAEQIEGLTTHITRTIERAASRFGVPDKWVVPIGSDASHVDTMTQTTTRGTQQGAQSVGSAPMMARGVLELYAAAIDQLAAVAPVEARSVMGNHDALLGFTTALALEQRYRLTDHVEVIADETPIQWVRVGSDGAAVALWHGDQIRPAQLGEALRAQCPRWCDLRRVVVVHGHLHRESVSAGGMMVIGLASPASPDDWHRANGYHSRKAINLVRMDGSDFTTLERVA